MRSWVERGTVLIRLSRPHFAFYRGYLDGVDPHILANTYLGNPSFEKNPGDDKRLSAATVGWIREQLIVAARRAGQAKSVQRLLQIEPDKLQITYSANVPTLEAFREERDPYEVYSEEALIDFFTQEYGQVSAKIQRKTARNDRLRARQRAALLQIEQLAAADPKLTDRVDGWLDATLAKHLKAVGIETLANLVQTINDRGYRWYTKVPKIGEKAAGQITTWLTREEVQTALGIALHVRGLVKRKDLPALIPATRTKSMGIVPLESFHAPSELDGSYGLNRGDRSILNARNDLEAIYAWLKEHERDPHTFRAYRKEAERFLLWSILEKGKPMSSLSVEDCLDYRNFLWDIGKEVKNEDGKYGLETEEWSKIYRIPQAQWIGRRGAERWTKDWRPFEKKLSQSSQNTAIVIVQSLLQYLSDKGYLQVNPMKKMKKLTRHAKRLDASRALSQLEWRAVMQHLASLKVVEESDFEATVLKDKYIRLRTVLALAYSTGLRLSELVSLRRGQFRQMLMDDQTLSWVADIVGKGSKDREAFFHDDVMAEIETYLQRRGHDSFDKVPDEMPIIAALPRTRAKTVNNKSVTNEKGEVQREYILGTFDDPLSARRLYDVLKDFFKEASEAYKGADSKMAERIAKASTHWLRHTFAVHSLQKGVGVEELREFLGHADLATTSVYTNSGSRRLANTIRNKGVLLDAD